MVPKAKTIDIEEQVKDTLEHGVVKPVVEDVVCYAVFCRIFIRFSYA